MDQLPPVIAATGPFFMYSLEETFEVIADAGFDGVELMITQDRRSQDPHRVTALSARYGLDVPAVHGPFLVATWLVYGADPRGKVERCVRFAQAAGTETIVIHPPYRWQRSYHDWLAERIGQVHDETGVMIAVENMFPVHMSERSFAFQRGTVLDELGDYPFLTLDTSHLAVAGIDLFDAWSALRDRVVHLHVSNNAGVGRDTHAPLEQGVLPIGAFLETVGASGFTGNVTLELDVRSWADDRTAVLDLLRENLELARSHLAAGARGATQAGARGATRAAAG